MIAKIVNIIILDLHTHKTICEGNGNKEKYFVFSMCWKRNKDVSIESNISDGKTGNFSQFITTSFLGMKRTLTRPNVKPNTYILYFSFEFFSLNARTW